MMTDKDWSKILSYKNPSFHTGNIFYHEQYMPGDSFQTILKRKVVDSLGSGVYTTASLLDVIDWKERKHVEDSRTGLFAVDLGDIPNLLVINSDEELDNYTDFLGQLTKYALRDIEFSVYGIKMTADPEKFQNLCHAFSKTYNIPESRIYSWVEEYRRKIASMRGDTFEHFESVATSFQKEVMGIAGVDVSGAIFSDSVSLGSVIFDRDSVKTYFDFGNDIEAAKQYYKQVFPKIMERKLKIAIKQESSMEELLNWCVQNTPEDLEIKEKEKELMYAADIDIKARCLKNFGTIPFCSEQSALHTHTASKDSQKTVQQRHNAKTNGGETL